LASLAIITKFTLVIATVISIVLQSFDADASPANRIAAIRRPVLYLNAADDPFSPMRGIPILKYGCMPSSLYQ
jgi:hypothetical protein